MSNKLLLIIGLLIVGGLLLFAWLLLGTEGDIDGHGAPGVVIDHASDVEDESEAPRDDVVGTEQAEIQRIDPEDKPEDDSKPEGGARVHGRFLLPGGSPAMGVEIELHGWPSNDEAVMEHGLPEKWEDLNATSDDEGRFEIRLDPPQAFQFTLDARLDDYSEVSWRWGGILPEEDKDLGDVELVQGGTIVVRIIDAEGEALKSGWTVYANSVSPGGDTGRDRTRGRSDINPATGVARLEDVPPGPAKLEAYSHIANWIEGPTVEVIAGGEVGAEIRYEGPDNSWRIVVVVFVMPFRLPDIDESSILISSDGVDWRPSKKIPGSSQSYAFDDLPPGRYTVKIKDELFEPWRREGIQPGGRVNAVIRCNAAVELSVVDSASNEPVEDYELRILFDRSTTETGVTTRYNRLCQLRAPGDEPPEGGIYKGIPPGIECNLIVKAEGYSDLNIPLGELSPLEPRAVEARMMRGTEIRGIVLLSDGKTPVAGIQVQLRPVGEPVRYHLPGSWSSDKDSAPDYMTETDDAGCFRFAKVPPGEWSMHAIANAWLFASLEKLVLGDGETKEGLRILLLDVCTLRGRLIGSPDLSFKGMRLLLWPHADPTVEGFWDKEVELELSAEGTFQSGPLPPGRAALFLQATKATLPYSFHSFETYPPKLPLIDVVLEPGVDHEEEVVLGDRCPGSIRVSVSRDGKPLAGHVVEIRKGSSCMGAVTGADGMAIVSTLFPGEWTVSVRPPESRGWRFVKPDPVRVGAGRQSECVIDVIMAESSIRIFDAASGKPLSEHSVWLTLPDESKRTFKTDSEGWLHLNLGPGIYSFSADRWNNPEYRVSVNWSTFGPVIDKIELTLPEDE